MGRRAEYRLTGLPGRRRPRLGARALLVSLLVHAALVLVWRGGVRPPDARPDGPSVFVLVPDRTAGHDQVDLPAAAAIEPASPATPVEGAPATPAASPDARPEVAVADGPAGRVSGGGPPPAAPARADTGAAPGVSGRLGPRYGDGTVWISPYPESPTELADRIRRSHGQLVDSAVTAIVQAYLDSLALEPGADRAQLPSWVADVGGAKFGLDSKYIYIAGLKIPSVVLALIPFPQGNVDQALANRRLQDLRADLFQAAQRAENAAEFKKAIREIRERKQQEEEFERNRRTPPDEESTP